MTLRFIVSVYSDGDILRYILFPDVLLFLSYSQMTSYSDAQSRDISSLIISRRSTIPFLLAIEYVITLPVVCQ